MKNEFLDHVEFYVGDAQQAAFILCTTMGFRLCGQGGPETGLAGQRSLLLRQGRIQLVLTSGLVPDHPATRYVARHGDGVARIAIGVPDVPGAFGELVDGGVAAVAEPVTYRAGEATATVAEVGGFGDMTHLLVARTHTAREFLPGAFTILDPGPEPDQEPLTAVDHVAVCLPAGCLAGAVEQYRVGFGFDEIFEEYVEVGSEAVASKVVQSPSGAVTLTLFEPDVSRQPGQIDGFLAAHGGPGVQHLALLTHDIVGTVRTLAGRGVRFLDTPDAYYDQLAERLDPADLDIPLLRSANVLVDRDNWGELFQIFTRSLHVRQTYFTEIIDRRGARTFGSRNIRALYEAVQRTRTPAGTSA
ncbi:MAG: 4-hydroxyphenylpyruvate dioxygenase [Natronosporangium sp.]